MAKFDADFARENLGRLGKLFEDGSTRFPYLKHYLIEATDERTGESSPPESEALKGLSGISRVSDPGPPARVQYYLADLDLDGEDLEEFRRLAAQATRIVDSLYSFAPDGLPSHEFMRHSSKRPRGGADQAENWMLMVHRMAWSSTPGFPIMADVSMPRLYEAGEAKELPPGHPALGQTNRKWIDMSIPGDCFSSSLGEMGVFEASGWAIRSILSRSKRSSTPDPDGEQHGVVLHRERLEPNPVPSRIQILAFLNAFSEFVNLRDWPEAVPPREREPLLLRAFIPLADATSSLRPLIDNSQGWSPILIRSVRSAINIFDEITSSWSWEPLAESEPGRSAYLTRQKLLFESKIERPYYETVLLMSQWPRKANSPGCLDSEAEEGYRRGFVAAANPSEGEAAYQARLKSLNTSAVYAEATPRFGTEQKRRLVETSDDLSRAGRRVFGLLRFQGIETGKPLEDAGMIELTDAFGQMNEQGGRSVQTNPIPTDDGKTSKVWTWEERIHFDVASRNIKIDGVEFVLPTSRYVKIVERLIKAKGSVVSSKTMKNEMIVPESYRIDQELKKHEIFKSKFIESRPGGGYSMVLPSLFG